MADYRQALIDAMDEAGITDPEERAGIAAIAGGESGFQPHTEIGYQHTSNDRIRQVFAKTRDMDDDELDDLKADPKRFFNFVYGGRFGNVPDTDDGYTYRGRGPFQLTFKDNYKKIGGMIKADIVANPDLVNDPAIGAKTVVAYIQDRYDGSGWEAMKDCVGYNTADISDRKDQLRDQFLDSREFA
ncbi:MAG TPA: glycoside hydrolase family 19 protein [Stellaceae bacterium]